MQLMSSTYVVLALLFLPILGWYLTIFIARRLNPGTISFGIFVTVLMVALPEHLMSQRILRSVGFLGADELAEVMEQGLLAAGVTVNIIMLLFAALQCAVLVMLKPFKEWRVNGVTLLFILLALLYFRPSGGGVISIFIYTTVVMVADFEKWMLKPLSLIIMAVYVYGSIFGALFMPQYCVDIDGKWNGVVLNVNYLTVPCGAALILLFLCDKYKLRKPFWTLVHISAVVFLVAMCGSRSALVCTAALLTIYAILKIKIPILWVLTGVLASVAVIMLWPDESKQVDIAEMTSLRWYMWQFCMERVGEMPLLGWGARFFSWQNRQDFFPTGLVSMGTAFSSFIEYAVCFGVVGLILFMTFLLNLHRYIIANRLGMLYYMVFILLVLASLAETSFQPPQMNVANTCYLVLFAMVMSASPGARTGESADDPAAASVPTKGE